VPLGEVIVEAPKSQAPASVLAGYYLKPDDDPWPNPALSRHNTVAVRRDEAQVSRALEYVFAEGSVVLGPGNWLLVDDGGVPREMPADQVKEGALVIRDVSEGRMLSTRLLGHRRRSPRAGSGG